MKNLQQKTYASGKYISLKGQIEDAFKVEYYIIDERDEGNGFYIRADVFDLRNRIYFPDKKTLAEKNQCKTQSDAMKVVKDHYKKICME